ncbi:glutaredoxin family protein [Halobacillus halophilus]|uniref:glutaredoxin family protein n=1 Tax=Halobacillus halophilus TaxID=1570 RepID=UPI0013701E3E|nr:glutaredoxin family protein [Halobacillus halophilus]MYL31664.1 glutaredoxin family protein [Halobacillus halophilus]
MGNQNVVVYTSRDCASCNQVMDLLNEWNIDFEERNVSENRTYFKELQGKGVYGTPATFVDDYRVLGFQKRKLQQVLGLREDIYAQADSFNFS